MPTTATPNILVGPGFLFIAPLASALPANTVAASKFSDAWPAAWLSLGATAEGSEFGYGSTVEGVKVAEFFDPIRYETTERGGTMTFSLASWTLTNYRRAMNGGVGALAATSGTTATDKLYTLEPPNPGEEIRAMIGWESLDSTVRLVCRQAIQRGEATTSFRKAPDLALIPVTYNMEVPTSGKPWVMWGAGDARGI